MNAGDKSDESLADEELPMYRFVNLQLERQRSMSGAHFHQQPSQDHKPGGMCDASEFEKHPSKEHLFRATCPACFSTWHCVASKLKGKSERFRGSGVGGLRPSVSKRAPILMMCEICEGVSHGNKGAEPQHEKSQPAGSGMYTKIPAECWTQILRHLQGRDLVHVMCTCHFFEDAASQDTLWKRLILQRMPAYILGERDEHVLLGKAWRPQYFKAMGLQEPVDCQLLSWRNLFSFKKRSCCTQCGEFVEVESLNHRQAHFKLRNRTLYCIECLPGGWN
ncbi:hypothetical protein CYMTET_30627 [Cymbomonas tetramitiformis]|uniref:F-box domain-containing protein n=1 Tax=Cymbomonas tetramitiformis TaxID=36881 RepID=A0AAE0FIF9_9CHLO|nr:hypothetical protein CYMTET_30627 [Cymbomonas tetramitiformis]